MITHCANPECNAPLHYLRSGRLFRFELRLPSQPCSDVPNAICASKPARATVFFWLCGSCAGQFSLKFDPRQGLELVASRPVQGQTSPHVSPIPATAKRPGA